MFTRTTVGIVAAIFYVAVLVIANIEFDDASKYPAMNKFVRCIDGITVLVALAVVIKFDLWC